MGKRERSANAPAVCGKRGRVVGAQHNVGDCSIISAMAHITMTLIWNHRPKKLQGSRTLYSLLT